MCERFRKNKELTGADRDRENEKDWELEKEQAEWRRTRQRVR